MGCKSSKNTQSLPPINFLFPAVNRPDIDDFFKRASLLFQKIETLRSRIEESKKKGVMIAETGHLKEDQYTRAVQVLFWALSSAKQGQIMKTDLVITQQSPFLFVNTNGLCKETIELIRTLQEYLNILLETFESVQGLEASLQSIYDEQIEVKKIIGPNMTTKAVKTSQENMKLLNDGIITCRKVVSCIPSEQKSAIELLDYMETILDTADIIGMRAYMAKLIKPADIFKWVEAENKKNDKKRAASTEKKKPQKDAKGGKGDQGNTDKKDNQDPIIDYNQTESALIKPGDITLQDHKTENQAMSFSNITGGYDGYNNQGAKPMTTQKTYEYQGSIRGHNGTQPDTYRTYTSFSGAQSKGDLYKSEIKGKVDIKAEGNKQVWKSNQAEGEGSVNESNNVSRYHAQQAAQQEKVLQKKGTEKNSKIQFFVREKELEIVIKDSNIQEIDKVSPGYLSPGGTKQAGILQGEENILDDDGMMHVFTNESVMIKNFTEKVQNYLDIKE